MVEKLYGLGTRLVVQTLGRLFGGPEERRELVCDFVFVLCLRK